MYDLSRKQHLVMAFALGLLATSALLALALPVCVKFIVDYVLSSKPLPPALTNWIALPEDPWKLLIWTTITVLIIWTIRIAALTYGRWYVHLTSVRLQVSLRRDVFDHLVRFPLVRLQELKAGGIASILQNDAGCLGNLASGVLLNGWRALIRCIGSACVLLTMDWRMLACAFPLVPLVYGMRRMWTRRIRPQFRAIHRQRDRIGAEVTEVFAGIRVVRAFCRQRVETSRFVRNNHVIGRLRLKVWKTMAVIQIMWGVIVPVGTSILLLYGGRQVIDGHLSAGDLMMLLTFIVMLIEPLSALAQSTNELQVNLSSLDRVLDVLNEPHDIVPSPSVVTVKRKNFVGRITFENVTFRYPGQKRYALRDINLDVIPGQTIALVGLSGSGKSTLCNLVARFYDPTEGRILLDGRDLRDMNVTSYRRLLGVVDQDVFLFDGTILENISYAKRDASESEVRRAAVTANADEFIGNLTDGYQTFVGERGVQLSGGQRQRIAIARAVLVDPRVLLLDEATSSLDTESEQLIQASLKELRHDRNCFAIAHRLSTIADADVVVVLDHGRIVEMGTQDELLRADKKYRQMVDRQTEMASACVPDGRSILKLPPDVLS